MKTVKLWHQSEIFRYLADKILIYLQLSFSQTYKGGNVGIITNYVLA